MNKTQAEKLTKFINEEFPEKISQYSYYNGECFCAIGALMNKIEPEFDFKVISSWENGESINGILDAGEKQQLNKLVQGIINEFGLDSFDLIKIQRENDNFGGEDEHRAMYIKSILKDIIESKQVTLD